MTRNYRIIFPILWAMLIYWLSSLPGNEANKILPEFWNSDKFAHMALYGVFGILIFRAGRLEWLNGSYKVWIAVSILIASLYGASDEFHQHFSPGRSCSVGDWVADSMGGAMGVSMALGWMRIKKVQSSKIKVQS